MGRTTRGQNAMQEDPHNMQPAILAAAGGASALARSARSKGPLVWLDMDQQELDDAYDQDVYAFNTRHINERRIEANAKALALIGKPERVAYGPSEIEKLDIYKTKRPNAPTLIFIHGGA